MKINCTYTDLVEVHKIIPNPKNNNRHNPEQIERLAKIIDFQGQRRPLIVSKTSGFLNCGHCTLEAIKKLGWDKCAVDYQEFESEAAEYANMTADNELARWAELDKHMMLTEIEGGSLGDLDLDLLGLEDFEMPELEVFDEEKQDDVPEVKHTVTKKGDVWLLGNHRVMCGDSTMIDDVERLINNEKIEAIYTDPPYGINESAAKRATRETNSLAKSNSHLKEFKDDSASYAMDAFNLCCTMEIKKQVWWGANYYCHSLPETSNWVIWDKRLEDKQRNNNSDCELAWAKSDRSSCRIFRHLWKGLIKGSEHGQKRVHPTQKPIQLAVDVLDFYKVKGTVLDLFLGSGSTLIACEKTNHKCYGMELDEHYCDVIVNRWQDFTGKEATLESSGETYNSMVPNE